MGQTFSFLAKAWDIDAAEELLKKTPRRPKMVNISTAMDLIRTNQAYVDTIDLKKAAPIIIGTIKDKEGEFWLPLDGWHRIRRAKDLGVDKLPAYILSKKETDKIEIRHWRGR